MNNSRKSSRLSDKDSSTEIIELQMRNAELVDTVVKLKQQNAELESLNNIHLKEKFELATKYNYLQNIVDNISMAIRDAPKGLLDLSNSITNILKFIAMSKDRSMDFDTEQSMNESSKTPPIKNSQKQLASKAHVVNPHTVNGHVLHIPTINLTRLHNEQRSYRPSTIQEESEINSTLHNGTSCSYVTSTNVTLTNDNPVAHSTTNFSTADTLNETTNQLSPIANSSIIDQSTPNSTQGVTPSTSTVLSATFKDVKIYLTQIPKEEFDRITERRKMQIKEETSSDSSLSDCNYVSKRRRTTRTNDVSPLKVKRESAVQRQSKRLKKVKKGSSTGSKNSKTPNTSVSSPLHTRTARKRVNYREPSLNTKLRRD